jgi:acyl dehydratase
MPTELYFEDFASGQVYELGTHTITAGEIIAFAREYDPQPMHTDPEKAKEGMLGGLAASGWHLCALAMRMIFDGLFAKVASLGSPGVEEIQWRRPVRPGDALSLRASVLEVRASASKPDRGFVKFRFDMTRPAEAGEERVMMYVSTVMFGKRGA